MARAGTRWHALAQHTDFVEQFARSSGECIKFLLVLRQCNSFWSHSMAMRYRNRPPLSERLFIVITPEQKDRLFALADQDQVSAATLVRRALSDLLRAA